MNSISTDFVTDLLDVAARLTPPVSESIGPVVRVDWPDEIEALGEVLESARRAAGSRSKALMEAHLARVPRSPLVASVSVFAALGHCRFELAHTQSLAWLLNPREMHGFGHGLLEAFVSAIEPNDQVDASLSVISESIRDEAMAMPISVSSSSKQSSVRVLAEHFLSSKCRADVLVEGSGRDGIRWALVVEAKIDAHERHDQLRDLLDLVNADHKVGVFLTVDGARGKTADEGWVSLTYKRWARFLLREFPILLDRPGGEFLRTYATGVLVDVCGFHCGESKAETLSRNTPFELENILGE